MLLALIIGSGLGFISAVPVAGPVSALIFSYGMRGKTTKGRWVAAGAGFAEAIYTFVAFWGFHHYLVNLSIFFKVSNGVAAALLFLLGIYFYRSRKMRSPAEPHTSLKNEHHGFFMGAGISFLNPTLIATWTAAMTTLYSLKPFDFTNFNGVIFSFGVGLGIVLWFSLMLSLMAKHRNQLEPRILDRGLKIVGILLCCLSVWMVIKSA